MTTLREAAQMALDVLEEAQSYTSCETWSPSMTEECAAAEKALRAALAQPPCATGAQCVGGKCERCAMQEREWVGLTHEELTKIIGISTADSDWNVLKVINWAKAIEAKLREKNFG